MKASSKCCTSCDDALLSLLTHALNDDDLDRAIALGLLTYATPVDACERCKADVSRLLAARDARLRALAARERYRKREARLAERAQAKAQKRAAVRSPENIAAEPAAKTVPGLPPAAVAALARAKAKAANRA